MSKINRQRGKSLERFVAKDLRGRRIGLLGMADVETSFLSIEAKERKKIPKFIISCLDQATKNANDIHMPLVILHELGKKHNRDIVILWYNDFKAIYYSRKKNQINKYGGKNCLIPSLIKI